MHAVTLLVILVAAAPLARFIPLAVLGAILLVVSYNMGEWHEIPKLLKLTKTDISVWLVTFALTVFADLTLAVEVGMILAALLFIRRVSVTTTVSRVTADHVEADRVHTLQDKTIPPYVTIFRIHGPFLFGMTDKIFRVTDHLDQLPRIVVVRLRNMTAIDATGLRAIEDVAERLRASGRTLLLCGAREQPLAMMQAARRSTASSARRTSAPTSRPPSTEPGRSKAPASSKRLDSRGDCCPSAPATGGTQTNTERVTRRSHLLVIYLRASGGTVEAQKEKSAGSLAASPARVDQPAQRGKQLYDTPDVQVSLRSFGWAAGNIRESRLGTSGF